MLLLGNGGELKLLSLAAFPSCTSTAYIRSPQSGHLILVPSAGPREQVLCSADFHPLPLMLLIRIVLGRRKAGVEDGGIRRKRLKTKGHMRHPRRKR
jgi:hypothetical protein